MNKIYINPPVEVVDRGTGIGRVIVAQSELLHKFGWKVTNSPNDADLIGVHVQKGNLNPDITFCHGLYFNDIPHVKYSQYHHKVNKECIEAVKSSYAVTVPSEWVGMPFKRDMKISPVVVGHGVDCSHWHRKQRKNYILWNKGRNTDVCDASFAYELAKRGYEVISTFYPDGVSKKINHFHAIGVKPHEEMRDLIEHANIYLATTLETFGIGTLEPMASGVPVLGFNWGGTGEIVTHKHDGYLVEYGDTDGLVDGIEYINSHYKELSHNAIETAKKYSWENAIEQYANLFDKILEQKRNEEHKVSIVITNYNYGKYVKEAFDSCCNQTVKPDEIIIVDDGSKDNSKEIIEEFNDKDIEVIKIYKENEGVAAARNDGIQRATGQYITFLDADDKIDKWFVETLKDALIKDKSLGIVYTGLMLMDENSKIQGPSSYPPEFNWEQQSAGGVPPGNCIPSGCMIRKTMWERAGKIDQQFAPGEDAEFWTRGLSVGFNAKRVTSQPYFIYRNHSDGASKTKKYKPIDHWLPWIRDKKYPMGAPARKIEHVNSYYLPQVSVIIPVGEGHEKYLKSAIRSLEGQTLRDWEVIIIDDTINGIKNYPNYAKYIRTDGKTGAGHARNLGIDVASAPTVLFLDADDFLSYNFLEKSVDLVAKENKYVYSSTVGINPGGENKVFKAVEYNAELFMTKPEYVHGVTAVVPTKVAKEVRFNEELPFFEDTDFYMRLAYFGVEGKLCNDIYLYYRLSTSTRRPQNKERANEISVIIKNNIVKMKEGNIMGCCGNKDDAIKELLRIRAMTNQIQLDEDTERLLMDTSKNTVRLEFIGENKGGISFKVPSGRKVVGGRNSMNRFNDVTIEDAKYLVNTGRFVIVKPKKVAPPVEEVQFDVFDVISEEVDSIKEPTLEADEYLIMKAIDAREAIAELDDLEILEQLSLNETRKTVLGAIEKRMRKLNE